MGKLDTTNQEIANLLERIAELLEVQEANPHRVRAYRNGAERVRSLDSSVAEMLKNGDGEKLQQLPDIGEGLARVITTYVHTGRSNVLDRLQGEVSPHKIFAQVPGIGSILAERIANQLDIDTLETLEQAAYDGRLAQVEGFGAKRIRTVQVSLAGILSRAVHRKTQQRVSGQETLKMDQPQIAVLLDVDAEYRRKVEADQLHKIAPRRFNPEGKAWLPILHTSRNGWEFTALFSNTPRAHDLNKTHDWVVIYYEYKKNDREDQVTVVTATHGPLDGKRIVRGREAECERYYQRQT